MTLALKTTAAIDVGLALLIKLLDKWLDYSDFKFSMNTNKIKDIRLFMNEASKLREKLGLPAKSFAPFSQEIDMKPADRWELLASISGWAMAYNTPLIITGPSPINIGQPDCVLGNILGRRYDTSKKNNAFSQAVDLERATMALLIRLLHRKSTPNAECLLLVAKDNTDVQEKAISYNQIQSACCLVRIERGWVTLFLEKSEKGPNPFNRAFMFTHSNDEEPFSDAIGEISESTGLDETVEFYLRSSSSAAGVLLWYS